jgi:LysM repeat protein
MATGSTAPAQSRIPRGGSRREEGAAGGRRFLQHLAPLARGLLLAVLLGLTLLAAAALGMEEQELVALSGPAATEPETATAVPTPTATRPAATPTPTEIVPTSSPALSPVPPSATPEPTVRARCVPPSNWRLYTVRRGESLSTLAWRYWTDRQSLVAANCLTSSAVYVGQRIYVPNVSPRQSCGKPSRWVAYTIQRGDTLSSIARRTGTNVPDLKQANCLKSDRIYAGATLWVPRLPWSPPTPTRRPTSTRRPTKTPVPEPSETATAITSPEPTITKPTEPSPTEPLPTEEPTDPPAPTSSPEPSQPTKTPVPTNSPEPTATPKPTLKPTTAPSPTPPPTATPTEDPEPSPAADAAWPTAGGTISPVDG